MWPRSSLIPEGGLSSNNLRHFYNLALSLCSPFGGPTIRQGESLMRASAFLFAAFAAIAWVPALADEGPPDPISLDRQSPSVVLFGETPDNIYDLVTNIPMPPAPPSGWDVGGPGPLSTCGDSTMACRHPITTTPIPMANSSTRISRQTNCKSSIFRAMSGRSAWVERTSITRRCCNRPPATVSWSTALPRCHLSNR